VIKIKLFKQFSKAKLYVQRKHTSSNFAKLHKNFYSAIKVCVLYIFLVAIVKNIELQNKIKISLFEKVFEFLVRYRKP